MPYPPLLRPPQVGQAPARPSKVVFSPHGRQQQNTRRRSPLFCRRPCKSALVLVVSWLAAVFAPRIK